MPAKLNNLESFSGYFSYSSSSMDHAIGAGVLQRYIFNYPLNGKSFHNHRYLPFHLKFIYDQPAVKKKRSLNKEHLSNYRPIPNLSFISKLTEKIVK